MGLATEQKPEGFLMVSDIVEDKAKPGSFAVTCVRQDGKTVQETKTKSEIEKNNLCKPTSSPSSSPSDGKSTAPDQQTDGDKADDQKVPAGPESLPFEKSAVVLKLKSTVTGESYIKRESTIDVTKSKATLVEGVDYCVVPAAFGADSICRLSSSSLVLRISGHTLKSCATMTDKGFIYEPHFSVTPATIPVCK
jgi:hypothetical protein